MKQHFESKLKLKGLFRFYCVFFFSQFEHCTIEMALWTISKKWEMPNYYWIKSAVPKNYLSREWCDLNLGIKFGGFFISLWDNMFNPIQCKLICYMSICSFLQYPQMHLQFFSCLFKDFSLLSDSYCLFVISTFFSSQHIIYMN